MDFLLLVVLSLLLLMPYSYLLSFIISDAYFKRKATYQRQLIEKLQGETDAKEDFRR